MGRAARQTVLSGYTWQNAADRTDEIVRELLRDSELPTLSAGRTAKSSSTVAARNSHPKLGFLSAYGGYGGTEEYLSKLARGAVSRGHDVTFFSHRDAPDNWSDDLSRRMKVVSYDGSGAGAATEADAEGPEAGGRRSLRDVLRAIHRRWTPKSIRWVLGFLREARRMRGEIARHRVDVLHFSDLGALPQVVAARLAGVPRLTGALNCLPRDGDLRRSTTYRLLESLCLACVDDIAAVSDDGRRRWVEHARVAPRKVRVVHNSTEVPPLENVAETAREVRGELSIPPDGLIIGVSAWLVPLKGHCYLLRAFREVLDGVPRAWLVLAGDGPCREDLERQAARLGIDHRVKFLGHRTDVPRLVQAYDVVALSSTSESLPFSLLEGMAYGRPAVGTAVGGVPELIEDGVNGYVVPPRDPTALAEAFIKLLNDPERLERMGVAARRTVEEEFNAERMVSDTLDMMLGC
jgi:glycosyltransferase involved in cell wall biosynthesis